MKLIKRTGLNIEKIYQRHLSLRKKHVEEKTMDRLIQLIFALNSCLAMSLFFRITIIGVARAS